MNGSSATDRIRLIAVYALAFVACGGGIGLSLLYYRLGAVPADLAAVWGASVGALANIASTRNTPSSLA